MSQNPQQTLIELGRLVTGTKISAQKPEELSANNVPPPLSIGLTKFEVKLRIFFLNHLSNDMNQLRSSFEGILRLGRCSEDI